MKKTFSILMVCTLLMACASATDLKLTIGATPFNAVNNTLTFSIAWNDSWKISSGPSNHDAVWIFIKRQACSTTNQWAHALLSTTSGDHSVTAGTNLLTVVATADGMGVFIRRNQNGLGNIGVHTVTLKFNSSSNTNPTIATTALDNFKVYGIEMAYVPQGTFFIGDGRSVNTSNFSNGNNANSPFQITAAIQAAGLGSASNYTSSPIYGCPASLPASFPLGYNGFYCMKYEISQGAYCEFLNSLNYDQQYGRMTVYWGISRAPNVINVSFDGGAGQQNSHVVTVGIYNTTPAIFSSAFWYKPQGNMVWPDFTAYLDWSGLRPMTEFEFEKACRGTVTPIPNEYPWGNTLITSNNSWNSGNTINETPSTTGEGNCCYAWGNFLRCGCFASSVTNRSQSGATYYGILDMGGNAFEQCIGGGNGYDYSTFTTINGDGALTSIGNANVANWPSNGGSNSGTILKGGGCRNLAGGALDVQVSDRTWYVGTVNDMGNKNNWWEIGGRGVRSF